MRIFALKQDATQSKLRSYSHKARKSIHSCEKSIRVENTTSEQLRVSPESTPRLVNDEVTLNSTCTVVGCGWRSTSSHAPLGSYAKRMEDLLTAGAQLYPTQSTCRLLNALTVALRLGGMSNASVAMVKRTTARRWCMHEVLCVLSNDVAVKTNRYMSKGRGRVHDVLGRRALERSFMHAHIAVLLRTQ